jgi:Grx4 family monothiol glutaredoxin
VPAFLFLHSGQLTDKVIGASAPDLVGKVRENAITASIHSEDPTEPAEPTPAPPPLEERLAALTKRSPVMLFMKGSPDAPRCGFSRQIVELLQGEKVSFGTFDILTDEEVRQGLKTFSNWPTYPQLYADGKLLGGLDVVKELQEEGELQDALPAAAVAA